MHVEYLTGLLQKSVCEKCGGSNGVRLEERLRSFDCLIV